LVLSAEVGIGGIEVGKKKRSDAKIALNSATLWSVFRILFNARRKTCWSNATLLGKWQLQYDE
jgi:hypothetical protein